MPSGLQPKCRNYAGPGVPEAFRIKGRQPSRGILLSESIKMASSQDEQFFQEYTAPDAIVKYTRATAGSGAGYLLNHDYKNVYLEALSLIPARIRERGIRIIEFGCGGGMNLIHLISVLRREGVSVETAIGTDFSPVLIEGGEAGSKELFAGGIVGKSSISGRQK